MFKLRSSLFQTTRTLNLYLLARFSFPKHELLPMPALSPTMKEGKIIKWLVKVGDKVEPGDAIAQVETDKATMAFEVQEKGFIAKLNASTDFIALGTPVAVITKSSTDASQFSSYNFGVSQPSSESAPPPSTISEKVTPAQQSPPVAAQKANKQYPSHSFLQMSSLSPKMQKGKVGRWHIKPGDSFAVGDPIFQIETDKASVAYEATEKGYLAKVLVENGKELDVGADVAIIVKKKQFIPAFSDFTLSQRKTNSSQQSASSLSVQSQGVPAPNQTVRATGERVIASPLAKTIANQKGIDLSQLSGSGPNGRIIKQDVQGYVPPKPVLTEQTQSKTEKVQAVEKKVQKKGFVVPENPYEDIALSSMRKTIANRLSESKQTIPHYYVTTSIEMGQVNVLRNELNKNQKQHGVKISVNDIIIKAMALALRDLPNVNVQWQGNAVRRFKYADISVAVAIDGGLITPIVHKADTLGLLDIARRTKDIAKRAREGKLDPNEYIGGTTTISNLGMYGINTVTSIINPPQSTILGVGKTEKKIVFAEGGPQPYRVAEIMDIIASCDHRAVDGALAAQWLNRIKHYLETPTNMLL